MYKKELCIDSTKIDQQIIGLLKELQEKGFIHNDGYLYYEEYDKEELSAIFSKYGKLFLE